MVTLTQSFRISSKFHLWIAFINLSFMFEYGFCLTFDNQDGRQNGRHISISTVVVTLTQSFCIGFLPNFKYELLLSNFHSSSNMGFVGHPITKMANKMNVDGALLFSACLCVCLSLVTLTPSFFIGFLPNFIYGLLSSTPR